MIGTQRRRSSRTAVLAAGVFIATNMGLMHLAGAQVTGGAESASPVRPTAPADFLTAPSIALGYPPAAMAGGDLTGSGHTDVVAADSATGEVVVYLSDGHGGFAAPARFPAIANPDAVAIADLDGDGKPDVIVASATTGTIAVLPGLGNGTYGSARSFAVGFNAGSLIVGDLTGNGHTDVAVAGLNERAVAVLVNDGKGNLAKPVLLATQQVPTGLAAGDFHRGGRPDIAVAQADGNVEIFQGQGGGQFRASAEVRGATGPITSISAGDFNRDGNMDLAVAAADGNAVAVLLGKGDGTFAAPAVSAVGSLPSKVLVADADGDGIPDLIVVNQGSNTFSVLKGAGDGSFEPARHFVAGNGPEALAAGEFYGTGHTDMAVLNNSGQTMSVAAAEGDGNFHAARSYIVGERPVAVAAGDVNGDGRPDLVVAKSCAVAALCGAGGSAQVLLGQADGTYQIGASYALGAGPETIALIDVNGDKHPDLVAANRVDKTLTVRLGLGDGTFGQAMTISLAGAPKAVAAGHFHGNGMTDLAVAEDCGSTNCSERGQVEILRGAGDGSFQSAALYPAGYAPVGLAVGSLDGSGKADIVVANRCGASADCSTGGAATVLLGDGAGNFKTGKSFGLGANPAAIALADLTGSGVQDAVVTRGSANDVVIFSGKGDGTFAAGVAYRVGSGPGALAIADFNGDGKPDVAVANGGDATVSVLFGRGDGTLQPAFALPVSGNPSSLAAIGVAATSHASLATTNGSTGSAASAQSSITVISNVNETPALTGGPTPNISVTWTSGSSSPSQVNESVSFTATVTGTPAGGPPTGGSVEFSSDGTAISDCGGSSGMTVTPGSGDASTAICATSVLTASASGHAITAQYLGANDTVYDDSKPSASITQVVSQLAPKIDLTTVSPSPASPQSVNTAVTFTATLSGVTFTPTTPTGTVEFQADGTTIAKCSTQALSPSGSKYQAQCTTSSLPATPSPHSIVAIFNGDNADTNYKQATATSISYTIKPATPALSLTATPGDSEPVNTSVTFTAQLSGSFPAAVPPDGTVSFKINGAASSSCPAMTVDANGSASCTTSSLVAPSDKVEAAYSGDSNYVVAGTATAFETITQATPVVTIQQPSPAPVVNQQVTLTAQVAATGAGTASAVAPTGSVTFAPAGTTCTSPVGLTGNPGTAPCSYTFRQATASGITIKASYSGDADYSAASATVSQVVNAASTTVGLTPTPASPAVSAQVSFQATVAPQFTGTTVPTGSVVITDTTTGTQICKQTLSGGAVPACVYKFTASGTHNIEAAYTSGDSNFTAPSQPTTVAVNVGAGTTSVSLTSSSNQWTVNQGVTFTATINAGGTMSGLAGSMVFLDQTTSATLCTASVAGNGTVPCKMTQGFTTAGLNSVVAEFTSSNHNFNSVNSAALAQTVNQDPTTTGTPTGSPSPSAAGQAVQFNVTVTPTFTGPVTPSGTVTVSANLGGAITQCQFTLPGTSCSMTLTQAGKYSVTATYAGDTNFSGSSTVSAATQTVGPENESIVIAGPYSCSPTATPSAANGGTGCCLPGLVNKACTGYATLLTQAPTVNQQVYFSATLAPTNPGSTVPTGPLLFNARDNNGNKNDAVTCQSAPLSKANVGTASTPVYVSAAACGVTFLSATKTAANGSNVSLYSVFATYAGDTNFPAQSSSPFFLSSVLQSGTSLSLTPDAATVMASQPMTFTATLTAISPGATAPTGPTNTVQFNFSPATNVVQEGTTPPPGTLPCSSQPVSITKGVATATCTVVFQHSVAPTQGPVSVSATYSGDPNFKASSTPSPIAETVQDFSESLTVTPGATAVIVTKPCTSVIGPTNPNCSIDLGQGFANVTGDAQVADPLNPATIALTLSGTNGFTDPLSVVCTVNAVNVPQATPASPTVLPLCLPSTTQVTPPSYASSTPLTFQIVAPPSATVGQYLITVAVSDKSVSALSGNTTSFAINTDILSVSGPLNLASGASGATQAIFNTASGKTGTPLGAISCSVFTAGGVPVTTFTATCTTPSPVNITGAATDVPISISFQPKANAALDQSSIRVYAAAFATPLFAMIVWLGTRKSPRRNFFRFLGMVLVIVGMTSLNGCGGNFTGPNISVKTPIPPGAYYIEAVTTDSGGNSYYTVIPVEITAE